MIFYKNPVLYIILIVIFAGCAKQLNTIPTQTLDVAQALQSGSDVQVALVGAYTDLGNTQFISGQTSFDADLLGDVNEISWTGTFQQLTQMKVKAIPVDNSYVTNTWLAGYKAINDINNVLAAMSVVAAKDTSRISGEAKFIRGLAYFEMVRLYAKSWKDGDPSVNAGLPIVLTPTTGINTSSYVKRNTVAETYQQAVNDLLEAESKLPVTNGFYATKQAASGALARLYLQKGDYANAVQAANRAITVSIANGGGLNTAFKDVFAVANTKEDLFAVQVTATSGTNSYNTFYSTNGGRGDAQITATHLALYETGDVRKTLFTTNGGLTYTAKFDNKIGNIHFIRLAEMYLTRAEGNFALGTAVGDSPLNDINKIRSRAALPSFATADLTMDKIIKERKMELSFEGFTLHDVKRLQLSVGNLAWNSPNLVFPIPKREIVVNANLTQNTGY